MNQTVGSSRVRVSQTMAVKNVRLTAIFGQVLADISSLRTKDLMSVNSSPCVPQIVPHVTNGTFLPCPTVVLVRDVKLILIN